MHDQPLSVSIAQAVGIFGALYTAGASIGISYFLIPAIRQSPTPLLLSQWHKMYKRGAASAPPAALFTSSALAYVSYHFSATSEYRIWALAASAVIGIVPFTLILIYPTNKELESWLKNEGRGIERKDIDDKLTEWTCWHTARSCLLTSGGLLALFAMIR